MNLLDPEELGRLLPAETHAYPGPIPTQCVSSDEFMPGPQTPEQRQVQARLDALGGALARQHGLTRRRFFQTAAGMAAAFVAMNEVYGRLFDASVAEAQTPDMAKERAAARSKQFVMDCHTGAADGPVKSAILGENNARLYKYERRAALDGDRIAAARLAYEQSGPARSNLRYGCVLAG